MKNKKIKLRKNGFSLIEMVVAVFVFSIISLTAVAVFANVVRTREYTRDMQKDLESSRTAIEQMAKNMRLSTGLASYNSNSGIYMYNTSQEKCVKYQFVGKQLESSVVEAPEPEADGSIDCESASYDLTPITEANITKGKFFVTETDVASKVIGRVTIVMTIDDKEHLQTSVSLIDYTGIIQ